MLKSQIETENADQETRKNQKKAHQHPF